MTHTSGAAPLLTIANEHISIDIDPVHGAEITRIARPDGANALAWYDWSTPAPAEREHTSYGNDHLDWLSRYRGGWQELFPNEGMGGTYHDVPMAFHGDVSMTRWAVERQDADSCVLSVPSRLPLVLTREMRLAPDSATLLITETVTNDSDLPFHFLWGHHPVFPSIPGAVIDVPEGSTAWAEPSQPSPFGTEPQAWPHLTGNDGVTRDLSVLDDAVEQRLLYFERIPEGWLALRQPADSGVPGIAMSWDTETWPDMWYWLQNGTSEFPWYGRARMLELGPHTATPLHGLEHAVPAGGAHQIGPREQRTAWLTLTLLDADTPPVTGVDRDGVVRFGKES